MTLAASGESVDGITVAKNSSASRRRASKTRVKSLPTPTVGRTSLNRSRKETDSPAGISKG